MFTALNSSDERIEMANTNRLRKESMKKTALASCLALGLSFLSACSVDTDEDRKRTSELEKRVRDARVRTCTLPDGTAFVLTARAANLGKHDVFSVGRNGDAFAAGFYPAYHGKRGTTTLTSFTDNHPDCLNYGISGNTLFALADNATFRFMSPNGRRVGPVLFVSGDGGLTFGENIHPNAREKAGANQAIQSVFQQFGYHRARFRTVGEQYQLEIGDPLNFSDFLLFVSSDGGKQWTGPVRSKEPIVFSALEVESRRAQLATYQWLGKVSKATNAACMPRAVAGCALATDEYWSAQWQACLLQQSARDCLNTLPEPSARLTAN